ncbi:helix-turn-helix domain-containing protein [Priestia flexa]|uniref:helix-turn-helix domain-containing protein n=1 Tax=Priestia flexa TaxID=86664 RepID=UPI00077CD293|nr:helix-turn-helix transcriptional regulator [Priestia flexa]MED4587640.1 helix-turn-helix transcriptional regulator [Priestia flexa]
MFGLGKKRSKLGKFIDKYGISQEWVAKKSGLGRNTIGRLVGGDPQHAPTATTIKKIMKAIREIKPDAKVDDFFDL